MPSPTGQHLDFECACAVRRVRRSSTCLANVGPIRAKTIFAFTNAAFLGSRRLRRRRTLSLDDDSRASAYTFRLRREDSYAPYAPSRRARGIVGEAGSIQRASAVLASCGGVAHARNRTLPPRSSSAAARSGTTTAFGRGCPIPGTQPRDRDEFREAGHPPALDPSTLGFGGTGQFADSGDGVRGSAGVSHLSHGPATVA